MKVYLERKKVYLDYMERNLVGLYVKQFDTKKSYVMKQIIRCKRWVFV